MTVRTGRGSDTTYTKYQNRRAYVWNNVSDAATLRKASGTKVYTCSYNSSRYGYKKCRA